MPKTYNTTAERSSGTIGVARLAKALFKDPAAPTYEARVARPYKEGGAHKIAISALASVAAAGILHAFADAKGCPRIRGPKLEGRI